MTESPTNDMGLSTEAMEKAARVRWQSESGREEDWLMAKADYLAETEAMIRAYIQHERRWRPISDDTPRNRQLLLCRMVEGEHGGEWRAVGGYWACNSAWTEDSHMGPRLTSLPTHYQEIDWPTEPHT